VPEGTVKQPALEKCLGCARAASTYPQSTFAEIATQYRSNPEFKAAFEQCKHNMVKGCVSNYMKPFKELQVLKQTIYGSRLESAMDFLTLDSFMGTFGTDAKEAVPDLVLTVSRHDGSMVEGVAVRPINASERLILFSEEVSCHQDTLLAWSGDRCLVAGRFHAASATYNLLCCII